AARFCGALPPCFLHTDWPVIGGWPQGLPAFVCAVQRTWGWPHVEQDVGSSEGSCMRVLLVSGLVDGGVGELVGPGVAARVSGEDVGAVVAVGRGGGDVPAVAVVEGEAFAVALEGVGVAAGEVCGEFAEVVEGGGVDSDGDAGGVGVEAGE